MKRWFVLFAATGTLLFGQVSGTSFSGPTLGFVHGSMVRELLPIRGIPGAARLGDAIQLPNTVTQIYLAPGQLYALAAQGEAGPVAVVVLRAAGGVQVNPVLTPLGDAMARPDLVAFSPTGGTAAFYFAEANCIQIFAGLPNTPRLMQQISSVLLSGGARALAISDDAQAVLIADATGTVYSEVANGAPVAVYHASQISALAFVSGSHDAIVCDPVLGSAAILEGAGTAGVRTVQPPFNGGCQASAAASTADGGTILVACEDRHSVWLIDRMTGATSAYSVSTKVTALDRLGAKDAFVMSPADSNGTYWVLTWEADGPVMSFVGAARSN